MGAGVRHERILKKGRKAVPYQANYYLRFYEDRTFITTLKTNYITSQFNPVHTLTPYFSSTTWNTPLTHTLVSQMISPLFSFSA